MTVARPSRLLAVAFAAFFTSGCLPLGFGGSAGGFGGVSTNPKGHGDVGGEASFHFYPQGTRGLALAADATASGGAGAAWRGGLGAGYAYVPAPYESPWGYELLLRGGLGDVPGDSSLAFRFGTRAMLLYRPGQSDTIWHQDRGPTAVLWYVGPFVIVDPAVPFSGGNAWVDFAAGLAVHALHYDIGAP